MNRELILQNDDGQRFFCVLDPQQSEEEQLMEVFAIHKGYGFTVEVWEDRVRIVDYFHGETRANFTVLARTATDEPVCLQLKKLTDH